MLGETDTENSMFDDDQVTLFITSTSSKEAAILMGWKAKEADFANLVTTIDGAATRQMSDLYAHAQQQVKVWSQLAIGPAAGRSRVGKIVRTE